MFTQRKEREVDKVVNVYSKKGERGRSSKCVLRESRERFIRIRTFTRMIMVIIVYFVIMVILIPKNFIFTFIHFQILYPMKH